MDIAAMSISMSTAKVAQQAAVLMTKKTMDIQETETANLIEMMQTAGPQVPSQGLDIRA